MIGGGAGSGKTSALLAAAARPERQRETPRDHLPERQSEFARHHQRQLRAVSADARHLQQGGALVDVSERQHPHLFAPGRRDRRVPARRAGVFFHRLRRADAASRRRGRFTRATDQLRFSFMQSRLRAPAESDLTLEVRATATPGGSGMQWVKAYFRIGDSGESSEFVDEVTGFRRAYFKITVADNPALNQPITCGNSPTCQRRSAKRISRRLERVHRAGVHGMGLRQAHRSSRSRFRARGKCGESCDDGYAAPACVLVVRARREIRSDVRRSTKCINADSTRASWRTAVLEKDRRFRRELCG